MPSRAGKVLLFEAQPLLRDNWDYAKNIGIDPERVVAGSAKPYWWKCSAGHQWERQVRLATRAGSILCLQCTRGVSPDTTLDPTIAAQLDDPKCTANELTSGSARKVWWKCAKGHRFEQRVDRRVLGILCPECKTERRELGQPIIGKTDLATLRPDLASQWAEESIQPHEVTIWARKQVKWKCDKGHYFVTSVRVRCDNRTKGNGCPICPGSRGRYAKVLVGVNDLATLHPEIAAELHSAELSAQGLRAFSNKKVEWKCPQGHVYTAIVADRVVSGSGCVECSTYRTSKIERRLRELIGMQDYLTETEMNANHKLPVPWRKNKSMEVDTYCRWRGYPVVVEYDGGYWHNRPSALSRDLDKTNALLSLGYLVVRLRENGLTFLDVSHPNLLQLDIHWSYKDDTLEEALKEVEKWLNSRV